MKLIIALALIATPLPALAQTAGDIIRMDTAIGEKPRAGTCRYEGLHNWWHKILTCYKRDAKGKLVYYYVRGR